jgi:hypothetical protein
VTIDGIDSTSDFSELCPESFSLRRLCPAGSDVATGSDVAGATGSDAASGSDGGWDSSSPLIGVVSMASFFFGFGPRFFRILTSPVTGFVAGTGPVAPKPGSEDFLGFLGGGFSWLRSLSKRKYLSCVQCYKTFYVCKLTNVCNNLECMFLASLTSLD